MKRKKVNCFFSSKGFQIFTKEVERQVSLRSHFDTPFTRIPNFYMTKANEPYINGPQPITQSAN